MADGAPSFFETAAKIAHARFPVVVRTHTLIDTTDHTDAVLIGLDGPTPVDEIAHIRHSEGGIDLAKRVVKLKNAADWMIHAVSSLPLPNQKETDQ